jgi:hypothetical protein
MLFSSSDPGYHCHTCEALVSTYEGRPLPAIGDYQITESTHRPASCRFEASLCDGSASLFAPTLEELRREIDDDTRA